jgi:hypothetical protein
MISATPVDDRIADCTTSTPKPTERNDNLDSRLHSRHNGHEGEGKEFGRTIIRRFRRFERLKTEDGAS